MREGVFFSMRLTEEIGNLKAKVYGRVRKIPLGRDLLRRKIWIFQSLGVSSPYKGKKSVDQLWSSKRFGRSID
jgi:hypothetical protein